MKVSRIMAASLLIITLLATVFQTTGFAGGLKIGAPMPAADVKMKNINGEMVSIDDIKGKLGTAVIFSCNSCPWSVAWEERITEIGNSYMGKGVGVIQINSNDPVVNAIDAFAGNVKRAAKLGIKFSFVADNTSNVARAFGAERTPEVFLFNSENTLIYHGAVDDNAQDAAAVKGHFFIEALDEHCAGKRVSLAETKAMGCSIKFRAGS